MSIGEKGGGRNVKILSPKQKVKRIILASELQLCNCRKEASKKLGLDEIRTRASQFTTQIWVGLSFLNRNVITADDKKNTLYFISSWSHSFCGNAEPTIFASLPNCGFLAQSVIAPNIYLRHSFEQRQGLKFLGLLYSDFFNCSHLTRIFSLFL